MVTDRSTVVKDRFKLFYRNGRFKLFHRSVKKTMKLKLFTMLYIVLYFDYNVFVINMTGLIMFCFSISVQHRVRVMGESLREFLYKSLCKYLLVILNFIIHWICSSLLSPKQFCLNLCSEFYFYIYHIFCFIVL